MDKFSEIAGGKRLPLEIRIPPWLRDHQFLKKAVFPAASAMCALAKSTISNVPGVDVTRISDAAFTKFLVLPEGLEKIEAFNQLEIDETGHLKSTLITIFRSEKTGITRVIEHVSLHFGRKNPPEKKKPFDPDTIYGDNPFKVEPTRIYEELVPFGPAFGNIIAPVLLTRRGALAEISGGQPQFSENSPLGTPFALDAAFHAACVWGQRYHHYTAFPVGLKSRCVYKPTVPGESYVAMATPIHADSKSLIFDIRIYDRDGQPREENLGVLMKDVSGGRLKPPQWIFQPKSVGWVERA